MSPMYRLGVFIGSLLLAGVASADRPPPDEVISSLLRRHEHQAQLVAALSTLFVDPRFKEAQQDCWGTSETELEDASNALSGLDTDIKSLGDALKDFQQKCLGSDTSDPICSKLGEQARTLEKLEKRLRTRKTELFLPRRNAATRLQTHLLAPSPSYTCATLAKATAEALASSTSQVASHWREQESLLRASFLFRAVSSDVLATTSSALGSITSQPLGLVERLGGTDQLSLALSGGLGAAHALSGGRLQVNLPSIMNSLFTNEDDITGKSDTGAHNVDKGESGLKHSLGFRFELPLTRTAVTEPFPDEHQRIAYQYGLWALWNIRDLTDPRRPEREQCYQSAEALSPSLGTEPEKLAVLEQQRYALYSLCARQALPTWRLGVRAGVTLETSPRLLAPPTDTQPPSLPDVRVGAAALGLIYEVTPWVAFQLMGRRILPDSLNEGSAAIHIGGGMGGRRYGIESLVHVGIDFSTTWRGAKEDDAPTEFSALAAPSLAVRLGSYGALGISAGRAFGGPRAGWTGSLALVWDMDRYIIPEPPPLTSLLRASEPIPR
ncbi:hypothetical protein OWM54_39720 [Myxococcus sp. MISCRS1]|uniref:hypothetical protein n=1 Tax=Myxococcus sp. MISCRS1 TaxID=2996786 RepID=UPI00227075D0|nr:hypothetical protein [Myxococcus sp. MISCRS1]MCY1003293.1 hypothetical protein [Myxococcus sp. MISCRS1]